MENKKIGCSAGKTILVDPNTFDGQSSSSNISVPLEDLSISVQLETTKRARTVLTSNGLSNIGASTKGVSVKFIEGSDVSGKKVLTTKYTDLTTSFDSNDGNSETLGITNIDIDFNSSYAPLITINFVDVRGGAIFQNESSINEAKNKYAVFFQLPYPIYTLTIKGYYGMPVKYDLHMTKFSAKFNSQTGNFEITGSFIGYTYALLSDMLLGYLKAIPYTKLGKIKYDEMRKSQPNLLTLDELMELISQIDNETKKIKSSDEDIALLNSGQKKQDDLIAINVNLLNLGKDIDINDGLSDYKFIIPKQGADVEKAILNYTTNVKANINIYNTLNNNTIDENDFIGNKIRLYSGLTIKALNPSSPITEIQNKLNPQDTEEAFERTRIDIFNYAKRAGISENTTFDIYDLRSQYRILNEKDLAIITDLKKLRKTLGLKLKGKVKDILGLDPNVRNIIGIFTASVEALMSVLFQVSVTAMTTDKAGRERQLKKFGPSTTPSDGTSYDIKLESLSTSDSPSGPLDPIYYPWPEYRVNDAVDGLVETYLGEPGILDIPEDVTELDFINDLLNAFLTSSKKTEDANILAAQGETNWYPVNPLDTRLYVNSFPYTRLTKASKKDVINWLMIRAFTYLGYSTNGLTPSEIIALATAESSSVLAEVSDDTISSLTQLKDTDFYEAKATNSGYEIPIMKYLDNSGSGGIVGYYYNYIFGALPGTPNYLVASLSDSETKHLLPINKPLVGNFVFKLNNENIIEKANDDFLFLTNYKSSKLDDGAGNLLNKPYDGGVYVKMIKPSVYDNGTSSKPLPSNPPQTSVLLSLEALKVTQSAFNADSSKAGFSQFGGKYGIQEYKNININETLPNADFMSVFYQTQNGSNFLGKTYLAKNSSFANKRKSDVKSKFDISLSSDKYVIPETTSFSSSLDLVIDTLHGDNETHASYGENRLLVNNLINKSQNISFPYVFFQVRANISDDILGSDDSVPVSLFGSRFYYEQTSEYSKAFLFLHTLPWNGLTTGDDTTPDGIFNANVILNTFGNRAGFISAPRLWAAFIGGLLWRADTSLPIDGGSGITDPILWNDGVESFIPTYDLTSVTPKRDEYLTYLSNVRTQDASMLFSTYILTLLPQYNGYKKIELIILGLPEQAKKEFKQVFFDFVNQVDGDSDWKKIKTQSEVFNGPIADWKVNFNQIMTDVSSGGGLFTDSNFLTDSFLKTSFVESKLNATNNGKLVFKDYIIFAPYYGEPAFKYNYFAELRDESPAVSTMLKLLSEEIIIANMSTKIWQKDSTTNPGTEYKDKEGIYVGKETLSLYIETLINNFKSIDGGSVLNKKKQRESELFGTDNENLIKFQLYRTCKNIYDKWIGGTTSESNLIFRGGDESRNGLDKELAKNQNRSELALIDSFRFVNRSFKDIGDDMIINPSPVGEYLRNNPNASFYDSVTNLLSSNNFDFIALPSYINYGEPETLQSLFQPMSANDGFKQGTVGPSFVCVYVGQTSKNLDFNDSEYQSDGVTFKCSSNGGLMPTGAKDFSNSETAFENKVAVFAVNYSQQNQNIFKDINLDQNEFSETAESLKITDDIANRGNENNKTFGGQNMYNVYSVRSYKVGVEMMGNAMIQPMMYFQLNNIPMFHGAYMITHVTHSIKPNSMSTNFSGVRIRNVETPIMDVSDLFMSLLDSIEATGVAETNKNFGTTQGGGKNPVNGTHAVYIEFVDYEVLESDSLIYQEHKPNAKGDNWAMKEFGQFMETLSIKWYNANISLPGTSTLYINNFGAKGGGTNKNHGGDGGLHGVGLACDLQPMAKTKPPQKCHVGGINFDQTKNIEFIQMAIDLSNSQPNIKVQNIILNDPLIIAHFNGIKGSTGGNIVIQAEGHDNHIHIECDYPMRVLSIIDNNKIKDDAIASSPAKGSVTTNFGKLPTDAEKLASLGQI